LLEAAGGELVKTLVAESGKPVKYAEVELMRAVSIVRASAEEARFVLQGSVPRVDAYEYPLGNEERVVVELREPVGVVGGAQSYNNPASTFAHKVAPVVAAGNTVIVKPSSYTPLTALKMAEIFRKAGFPDGVVNVVVGSGEDVFNELIDSPKVAGISFTGSTAVGLQVAAKAAGRGKKFMIAPGGSDPAIVFEDADLEAAAATIVRARVENAGQNCNATKRVFVHRSVYDKVVKLIVEKTAALKVGNPMDPATDVGPLISDKMVKTMEKAVAEAREKGEGRCSLAARGWAGGASSTPPQLLHLTATWRPSSLEKRSLGRSCRWCPSTPRRKRWLSPTPLSTASRPPSTPETTGGP
jgi:succinyl-CoA reductase